MRLLQISDPHFGTERPEVVAGLLRLAATLAPDVVLLSGDITQRATRAQFAAARAFARRLGRAPQLAIPGNHDIPLFDLRERCLRPYARFQAAFGAELEPAWQSPSLLLQTVNTTRAWRHKDGDVSRRQVERVAARAAAARPEQLRVVALHHPVAVWREQDRPDLLHGRAAALRRWAAAGVDLVLGGHIHLPYVLGLHESGGAGAPALPGLARPFWVVQAGTAVSSRIRH